MKKVLLIFTFVLVIGGVILAGQPATQSADIVPPGPLSGTTV